MQFKILSQTLVFTVHFTYTLAGIRSEVHQFAVIMQKQKKVNQMNCVSIQKG